ncbi:BREX system serine/threonine kinase PglW [Nocardia wallacei]|uniref:BREX system serine/threonine kinase PglW n=1 Tax=Nocardia wallacei TaxID=480035 RepID=UPI00245457BF|nr:BREX system serine/threonine kinase PglW [Nocardia wallacei]
MLGDDRWVEVSPSQFSWEQEGLQIVRQLLPDAPPFRAWSNFEFRDNHGRWHEIDLAVLARDRLYLIELKYWKGVLSGDDYRWARTGHRPADSPLLLARRKAQYFSSLLKDKLAEISRGQAPRNTVPWVQELVFLHHPKLVCQLPLGSRQGLCGLDSAVTTSGLQPISEVLLAPADRKPVSEKQSALIAGLIDKIGIAERRQREVGSWVIDDPLDDGEGWQDWNGFHHADQRQHVRIRFYPQKPGTSSAEQVEHVRAVEHGFRVLTRLRHDSIQVPRDVVKDVELGVGLVFDQPTDYTRLDLWLAEHHLGLEQQLELLHEIAGAVRYAHRHRVVHRLLCQRAVSVRLSGSRPVSMVTDWDNAGVLPANAEAGVTKISSGPLSGLAGDTTEARLLAAPEGRRPADPARMDVFGLGVLAYFLLTGVSPATERGELLERLRRDHGLDPSADLPQISSPLRKLIIDATRPGPAERLGSVAEFLARLDEVRAELVGVEGRTDPLEAGPGALLDDRFEYKQRLGAGSTAVGILVADRQAGGAKRVLKVAKDDSAAARLQAEADVLGRLDHDRIARLQQGVVPVGGRATLVLQFAGTTTLAEELSSRGRLSIDLLERWGVDLLSALVALEREGLAHRDIKPSNLGVWSSSGRADTHLVLFDFSMAGVDPKDVNAGTPPYHDPFLGLGGRKQYDSAAERYGAAAVLFEMATGRTPQYGPDPDANAAVVDDDVSIELGFFESAVADALAAFFASALSREVSNRPDTAEDMLRGWRRVFNELDTASKIVDTDAVAAKATVGTPLTDAGLSARAVSALATAQVVTVGELLALDPAKLNWLLGKEGKATRQEVTKRRAQWQEKLGEQRAVSGGDLLDLDQAVQLLLAAVPKSRAGTKRQAAELLLGECVGLDAFANQNELGAALSKTPMRAGQVLRELQKDWGENHATRQLLDDVVDVLRKVIADFGGVAAISTLTSEVRALLPNSDSTEPDKLADRKAEGLIRLAFDRLAEHEKAEGETELARRRHGGRLALVAENEVLLAAAEAVGRRADELVSDRATSVVPTATAVRELSQVFVRVCESADLTPPALSPDRLIRLAAAASRSARASGRSELHNPGLPTSVAVKTALAGLAQSASLEPSELRDRVATRFPAIDRLPPRPMLDRIVENADLGLDFRDGRYRFHTIAPASDSRLLTRDGATNVPTRAEGTTTTGWVGFDEATRTAILGRSIDEHGFLAIGVTIGRRPGNHLRAAEQLAAEYHGEIVDVTGEIIAAMRSFAENRVPWDVVRAADAATPSSRDARGLRALVDQVVPQAISDLDKRIFGRPAAGPLILTELSPLARYGFLDAVARWSDLTAQRARPVWAILPQMWQQRGAQIDGKPIQLGAPSGQFVEWQNNSAIERVM